MHLFFCFFLSLRTKYPRFVQFFSDQMDSADCMCCLEALGRQDLILTNPCGHFICQKCAAEMVRIWSMETDGERSCPTCRVRLTRSGFRKPFGYMIDNFVNSKIYSWVPSSVYFNTNHRQEVIVQLSQGNFHNAFKSSFICNLTPSFSESIIAPLWPQYFKERVDNMHCSACWIPMALQVAFMAKCGHFYCTGC